MWDILIMGNWNQYITTKGIIISISFVNTGCFDAFNVKIWGNLHQTDFIHI